jgi:hypothetical protein
MSTITEVNNNSFSILQEGPESHSCEIAKLPKDMLVEILQWINAPKDVVNLNLVCKAFESLNKDFNLIKFRIRILLGQNIPAHYDKNKTTNFMNYKISVLGAFCNACYSSTFPFHLAPKSFYDSLPRNLQNAFKRQIWIENKWSSISADGVDHGIGFGDYVVAHDISGNLARSAVLILLTQIHRTLQFLIL